MKYIKIIYLLFFLIFIVGCVVPTGNYDEKYEVVPKISNNLDSYKSFNSLFKIIMLKYDLSLNTNKYGSNFFKEFSSTKLIIDETFRNGKILLFFGFDRIGNSDHIDKIKDADPEAVKLSRKIIAELKAHPEVKDIIKIKSGPQYTSITDIR